MDKQSRRDALRDYKEKKVACGIVAVRCAATGEAWVGLSRNLGAQQNSLWFSLRMGSHMNKALQAAWAAHGQDGLSVEVLETVDDADLTAMGRADLLKRREAHWLGALGAKKLAG